ncbi:MAG: substrate-binding domain-containing protein [Gemmatimonadota bacterium]
MRPARRLAVLAGCFAAVSFTACAPEGVERSQVRIASTTSLYDTGLLDELVPAFHAAHPEYEAQVVAVGTGEALKLGERRDADLVIVHAPERERAFVTEGHGLRRTTFMQNDFALAGPEVDPAGVGEATEVTGAFRRIADAGADFASRGDDSGTHIRERSLWSRAGLDPAGGGADWYLEVGQGMGATLLFASEREAYVLTDRATLTTLRANGLDLVELFAGGGDLVNVYSVIPIAEAVEPDGAAAFEAWILGGEASAIIDDFGVERYGRVLFTLTDR